MVQPYAPLYTVKEAAIVLKTNPSTVYSLIQSGKLIALRLGSIKIRGSDLERFIEKFPVIESEEMEGGTS